jgi:hypothetical protein
VSEGNASSKLIGLDTSIAVAVAVAVVAVVAVVGPPKNILILLFFSFPWLLLLLLLLLQLLPLRKNGFACFWVQWSDWDWGGVKNGFFGMPHTCMSCAASF